MSDTIDDILRDAEKEFRRSFAASGGRARAAAMTPEERSEAAKKAITARWNKYRRAKKSKRVSSARAGSGVRGEA